VQVDRLAAAQPEEKIGQEDRQLVWARWPAEVGDLEAEELERGRLVCCHELARQLLVFEQAGDGGNAEMDQRGDAFMEIGPWPADEPAFRGQGRMSDRDQVPRRG